MVWRMRVFGWDQRTALPQRLPNGLEMAYREWERDAAIYMPPAIAQVVGWWVRHRYDLHRLGLWLGVLSIREGDIFRAAWWSWPWNGNQGPWARHYLKRHGWAAYKARYAR